MNRRGRLSPTFANGAISPVINWTWALRCSIHGDMSRRSRDPETTEYHDRPSFQAPRLIFGGDISLRAHKHGIAAGAKGHRTARSRRSSSSGRTPRLFL